MAQQLPTGNFDEVAAKLKADLETSRARFAADVTKLKANLEARDKKFNADLEVISPHKPKNPAKANSSGKWILARKAWEWLYRD